MSSAGADFDRRAAIIVARLAAKLENLKFTSRRAAEAMHDFADAHEISTETPNAQRAAEIADAAFSRAKTTGY